MILSHQTLLKRFQELVPINGDVCLVNPASIDIRVGKLCRVYNKIENDGEGRWIDLCLDGTTTENPAWIVPGEFWLVPTFETLAVPVDLAMELKLKSSRAREGYNHSLAFWFDPGWYGVGTMELSTLCGRIPIFHGMKIAQIIYHKLDESCDKPYQGKYQKASSVENSKCNEVKRI